MVGQRKGTPSGPVRVVETSRGRERRTVREKPLHASHNLSSLGTRPSAVPKVTLKTHPNVSATASSPQGASH